LPVPQESILYIKIAEVPALLKIFLNSLPRNHFHFRSRIYLNGLAPEELLMFKDIMLWDN
jgi:hypothetical protein